VGNFKATHQDYLKAIQGCNVGNAEIILVCLNDPKVKKDIKRALDAMGVPSQFVLLQKHLDKKRGGFKLTVISNIMAQMTAKVKKDLYRLNLNQQKSKMIVGFDLV